MDVLPLSPKYRYTVYRLWFTPSGRRLLVLAGHPGGANRLWNWDVPDRRPLGRRTLVTDPEHDNCFPFPAFDRTRRYMAFDGHVEDRKTGKRVKLEYAFYELTLTPDGRTVFAIADDWRIDRFDPAWGFRGKTARLRADKARSLVRPGKEYADDLAVGPAGDLLVVRTSDGKKLLPFRPADGTPLPAVELPVFPTDGVRMTTEPYGRLLFAPDGRAVAVAGDGVCLADPVGGRPPRPLDGRHFADLAFTPDGSRLVGVRPDGTAVEWDVASGAPVRSLDFKAEAGRLRAVAVAPDGLTAVAGGSGGRQVQWDL